VPIAELTGQLLGPPKIQELCQALSSCTGSVKALELDSNVIGHKGAAHLAETLARDNNINFVDLTGNGIGDAGAIALAARLGGNCALRHLDLTRNVIKGRGGLALGRMLTVNSEIRQLTLSENMLGAEGARAIGLALPDNLSLLILNLNKCGIGPKGARFIAQGLSSNDAVLNELSVGENDIMDDGAAEFAEMIRINRSIREFYADANGIEGVGAELMANALSNNDCLETLWMVGNALSINAVAMFARVVSEHASLTHFGISCTNDVSLPPAVLQDLEKARKRMAHRRLTRSLHNQFQNSLATDSSRDAELRVAARRGSDGARSPDQVSARGSGENLVQQILLWGDGVQVEELLEMNCTPRPSRAPRDRVVHSVHSSQSIAPINLSWPINLSSDAAPNTDSTLPVFPIAEDPNPIRISPIAEGSVLNL
jgi:hypothetical protein